MTYAFTSNGSSLFFFFSFLSIIFPSLPSMIRCPELAHHSSEDETNCVLKHTLKNLFSHFLTSLLGFLTFLFFFPALLRDRRSFLLDWSEWMDDEDDVDVDGGLFCARTLPFLRSLLSHLRHMTRALSPSPSPPSPPRYSSSASSDLSLSLSLQRLLVAPPSLLCSALLHPPPDAEGRPGGRTIETSPPTVWLHKRKDGNKRRRRRRRREELMERHN